MSVMKVRDKVVGGDLVVFLVKKTKKLGFCLVYITVAIN